MTKTLVLAGGCFWCYEPIFQMLKGVKDINVGYTGGIVPNPTYEEVSTGQTGTAEAFEITYDPKVIKFENLLEIFFYVHDPTQLNRQGADVGTQYRSAIFTNDKEEISQSKDYIKKLNDSKIYEKEIVTKIEPLNEFWPAEDYHQNFYNNNRNYGYCSVVIDPKIKKFLEKYGSFVN